MFVSDGQSIFFKTILSTVKIQYIKKTQLLALFDSDIGYILEDHKGCRLTDHCFRKVAKLMHVALCTVRGRGYTYIQ